MAEFPCLSELENGRAKGTSCCLKCSQPVCLQKQRLSLDKWVKCQVRDFVLDLLDLRLPSILGKKRNEMYFYLSTIFSDLCRQVQKYLRFLGGCLQRLDISRRLQR